MRARENCDTIYKQFKESGEKERIVEISPNRNSIEICKDKGISIKPIKLRLIRVELKDEVGILILK